MDELCVRSSPALWFWVAVSRTVELVLAFVISDRSDAALGRLLDEEMPPGWREAVPVCTDAWGAYRRLLPSDLHEVCSKQSGRTSIVEALNCEWRQRQSGLARKSCGVGWRTVDDPVRASAHSMTEGFLILAERHNSHRLRRWRRAQASALSGTQSDP